MNNPSSLATVQEQRSGAALVNWNDPKMQAQIRETYGKNLNENEWKLFVGLGVATGLNPFLREIWAVKYGTNPASVFIGRDGYRRSAQNHPEYEYHYTMAVYSKDTMKIVNGEVLHDFSLTDRGELVGAYCVVKRKGATRAAINFVKASEYIQKFGVWTTKPDTMTCKVAEAQGLRGSFQELFAGTYEESEEWAQDVRREIRDAPLPAARPVQPTIEAQTVETTIAPPAITQEQTRKLYDVWAAYKTASKMEESESQPRRKALMKELFGVTVSTQLSGEQVEKLIARIEEMTKEASL